MSFIIARKDSAEEQIKRELQAVAEGVAASVFHSSVQSNPESLVHPKSDSPPISQHNRDGQPANNVETEQIDKLDVCDPSQLFTRLIDISTNICSLIQLLWDLTCLTTYAGNQDKIIREDKSWIPCIRRWPITGSSLLLSQMAILILKKVINHKSCDLCV